MNSLNYGHRYYSPTQGRWLARDPAGERRGRNLLAFVNNSPLDHYDILGRACAPMQVTDLGHRTAVTNWFPNGTGERIGGDTTRNWVMSPVVDKCFPGFPGCQYKVRIRACWSSIDYWYDDASDRDHELQHVGVGVNNWNNLLAVVDGLVGSCSSYRKAVCNQSAISQYSDYFNLDYWATGYELDCSTKPPFSRECALAHDYRRRADAASTRAAQTLQDCSSKN
ncbi:MAG TPA: RHS repeat-associated core domain-containing protein [Verrucomicrobiae bacterium]|nr:RHS repeat-associated core domain-containing protein [Verrucomicrobiae bacterium]